MNGNEQYISPFKIKKKFDITSNTLRTWADNNKIRHIRIREGLGKRLYNINDIEKLFSTGQEDTKIKTLCYARVSSDHQKEDLNRQIKLLQDEYPGSDIISDIGSGLNFKRKGLQTLLEHVYNGTVKKVVVAYKDRLCRFGFEIIEWVFKKTNTEFVVLNKLSSSENSATSELAEDLLSITTVFVARNNGNRSANYRRQRKEKEKKEEEQD